MIEVFQIYSDLLIHFILLYSLGVLLLAPFKKLDWPRHHLFFLQLVLGILGVTSGYAIYFTMGHTVLVIIPLLYMITLSSFFDSKLGSFYIFRKEFFISISVLSLLLGIQFFRNDYFNPVLISYSDIDFGIYATVSEYLMHTGLEISSPWYANSSLGLHLVPQPYHYGDLWLSAYCLSSLFDLPSLSAYVYVFVPLISMMAFWGIMSLLVPQKKYGGKQLIFSLALTLLNVGIYHAITRGLYCNVFTAPKTFFLLLLSSIAILFLQKRNYWLTGICLAFIPLSNILFLPAIYGSLGLIFLYLFVSNRAHLKSLFPLFLVPVLGLIYITSFYLLFGKLFTGVSSVETDGFDYIYRLIRGIGSGAVRLLLFEFPFLILVSLIIPIWRKLKEKHQLVFVLLAGYIAGGLAGKAIFNLQESEIDQVFYLVANPTVIIFLAYFLGLSEWRSTFKYALWATYVLMLFSIINLLFFFHQKDTLGSKKFVEEVRKTLNDKNKIGVSISNPQLENIYTYDPRMCTYCGVLKMIGQDYWIHRLDLVPSLDSLKYPEKRNSVSIAPFYQFMKQQKKNGQWKNLAQLSAEPVYSKDRWHEAQIDFIHSMKADFIVLEKEVQLPMHLSTCVEKEMHDPISGTSIILIKRPCAY